MGVVVAAFVLVAACGKSSDKPEQLSPEEVLANQQPACTLLSKDDVAASFPELKGGLETPEAYAYSDNFEVGCGTWGLLATDSSGAEQTLHIDWTFDPVDSADICDGTRRPDLGPSGCELTEASESDGQQVQLTSAKGGLRYRLSVNQSSPAAGFPADGKAKTEALLKTLLSHAKG